VIMNKKIRGLGYRFLFTPDTRLWHYRSSSPGRFWRQKIRYGIGRAMIGKAYPELLNPMHILVGFSIPLVALALVVSFWRSYAVFAGLITLAAVFLLIFFAWAFIKTRSLQVARCVPLAIFILMFGWSIGFMRETFSPSLK